LVFLSLASLVHHTNARIHVQHVLFQSFAFALPMVGLITLFIGGILRTITGWEWSLCFLFGACLSATDPVSVIPVMKTTGAPHSLTLLVLAESLLSEGAATVVFHIMEMNIEGENLPPLEVIGLILREFVASVLFGILGGFVALRLMSFANQHLRAQDSVLQVGMCIICAYFTFYSAQSLLELSGVLSTCTAGIYVTSLGKGVILNHQIFHSTWLLLEWVGETLIFLIAGVIVRDKTWNIINIDMIPDTLLMFITILFIRFAYVMITYRAIGAWSGHTLTFKEAIFFGLTGLKGAMGVVLSLLSFGLYDMGYITQSQANRFLSLAAMIITFSLVTGGVATRYLIKWLELRPQENAYTLVLKRHIHSVIRADVRKRSKELEHDFGDIISTDLSENSLLFSSEEVEVAQIRIDAANLAVDTLFPRNILPSLLFHLRSWYLNTVRGYYKHHIHIGKLPRHSYSAQLLIHSIDAALDDEDVMDLSDFRVVERGLHSNKFVEYFLREVLSPITMSLAHFNALGYRDAIFSKRAAYAWTSFISAHEHARLIISDFLSTDGSPPPEIPEVLHLQRKSDEVV
jgi:NhaP-type Na+/H+ or K+/H+ antiporter